ncbi:hypothetical protein RFI_34297 [Reticulomyxa filosa]|uniref:Uncharacterized protein n=1 Tax=Reticulomyxa filosa TaxID=46433 RepID=X6LME1_RETFI|nr:hypothetical protein RFI_34297 [Reticulomyxa filosa]|eukprot:ETO03113.1 hypothetical protein RFI_34297 [Reticulomyxa filosa]
MWNHSIDLNLIYAALIYCCEEDISKTFELLFHFEQWKLRDNNEQNYKKHIDDFMKKRCCNHNVNLFCIFLSENYEERTAVEHAILNTLIINFPFVAKDKETLIKKK